MKKKLTAIFLCILITFIMAACSSTKSPTLAERNKDISPELKYDHSMELTYAE